MSRSQIKRAAFETLERRFLLSTYYVSPSGNDGSAGSSVAPFLSIQKGVSVLAPGDTLNVEPGAYSEGFVIGWDPPNNGLYSQISGTQQAPITIQADPSSSPGSVIITGANNKTHDGIDFEGGDPSGCNWITVKGFTINNASGSITRAGIRISGGNANVSLIDNVTTNCGTWGIFSSFSTGLLVQGNTCSDSQTQHGIYISNSDVGAIVRGNTVFGNALQGIQFNGDASQGGTGIDSGELVENNIVYDNGGNGINCDGLVSSRIQNNLIYDNANNGISLFQIDAAAGCTNNVIVNNTILDPSQWAIKLQDASTGNTIYNNILEGTGNGSIDCYPDCLGGLYSDYNIIANGFSDDGNDTQIPLTQWISDTGRDQHSILAPASLSTLFVDPSAVPPDYHLAAGSPAIDAGTSLPAPNQPPTNDLDGNPRPSGSAYDIGAYESVASQPLVLSGNNVYLKADSDQTDLDIWIDSLTPGQGAATQKVPLANLTSVTINGRNGGDSITLNESGGLISPASGITINGGTGSNSFFIIGSSASDSVAMGSAQSTFNSATINYQNVSSVTYSDGGGNDTISVTGNPPTFVNTSSGNDTISLASSGSIAIKTAATGGGVGTVRIAPAAAPAISLNAASGTISISASTGTGIRQVHFTGLSVGASGKVVFANTNATLGNYSNHANRTLAIVDAGGLNVASGGILDIGDNSMLLKYLAANKSATDSMVSSLVTSGYAGGAWSGTGITSSEANYDAFNGAAARAVGWADQYDVGVNSFEGDSVDVADGNEIMIKFTYYGDTDLDGRVASSDSANFSTGVHLTGNAYWEFGDFDYSDGKPTASDSQLFSTGLAAYKTFGQL